MNSVVERGAARCPRCMAVAEYRFLEGESGSLRYEVTCRPCGNVHQEICPTTTGPVAA